MKEFFSCAKENDDTELGQFVDNYYAITKINMLTPYILSYFGNELSTIPKVFNNNDFCIKVLEDLTDIVIELKNNNILYENNKFSFEIIKLDKTKYVKFVFYIFDNNKIKNLYVVLFNKKSLNQLSKNMFKKVLYK